MKKVQGLEDVIAVTTQIGRVDGDRGELVVRGHRMEEFAPAHAFEDATKLLWASQAHASELSQDLGRARQQAYERLATHGLFAIAFAERDPLDYVRMALDTFNPRGEIVEDAINAVATIAVAAAAHARLLRREEPIAPEPDRAHVADFLNMLTGSTDKGTVRALETYLVTVTDHGMNASTFTARVIASTQSDLISAVAGALGALKGPLHGGAPGPVLDMLDAIEAPENAEAWIRNELDKGRRIMGMGHRVYRVRDPRAAIFEKALSALTERDSSKRLALARAVEEAAEKVLAKRHPDRALKANVEFYTAVLLEAIGIDRTHFTATFAVGRALGWCAHIMEQSEEGRLIRPRSVYAGPEPT